MHFPQQHHRLALPPLSLSSTHPQETCFGGFSFCIPQKNIAFLFWKKDYTHDSIANFEPMILQIANIVSGVVLAAPGLKEHGGRALLEKIEHETAPLRENIGVITLVLGIIGLIDRMNFISFYIPNFGSSYPQAIPAILTGARHREPSKKASPLQLCSGTRESRFWPRITALWLHCANRLSRPLLKSLL